MVCTYTTGYDCTGATDKRRPEKLPDKAKASVSRLFIINIMYD